MSKIGEYYVKGFG